MQITIACKWLAACAGLVLISDHLALANSRIGSVALANPIIKNVLPQHCIASGGVFSLSGGNFGLPRDRELAIKKNSETLVPKIIKWTNTTISAQLPKLKPSAIETKYTLVIVDRRSKSILSNRSKTITICAINTTVSTNIPVTGKLDVRESVKKNNKQIERPVIEEPSYRQQDDNYNTPSRVPPSGSSSGTVVPQPTNISKVAEIKSDQYENNELVVISKDMASAKKLSRIVSDEGYRIKRRRNLKNLGFVVNVIGLPESVKVSAALKKLQQKDKSLLIDVNHRYSLQSKDDVKSQNKVQALIRWGKINKMCGKGISLGIVDSLVDTSYPGFRKKQIVNKSFLPLGVSAASKDHATAIASILVSQPDAGVRGLLPAATIYTAGVFRKTNDNRVDTTSELIVTGLNWLYGKKVNAINMSIAGPRSMLLIYGIERLLRKNILIAASVGNDGYNNIEMYPAAINGVVGVTAVDSLKRVFKHANRGKYVQIAAPGVDIWAARANGKPLFVSGTSFASPYIAASLAVLRKRNPTLTSHQITAQLINNAEDLGASGDDTTYGKGLVQFSGCQ